MVKKLISPVVMLGVCMLIPTAAQADWSDGFEPYTLGDVNGQGLWIDFGGTLTTDVTTAQAATGDKSLAFSLNPAGGGDSYGSDAYVIAMDGAVITAGQWVMSYELYIPTGYGGSCEMFISQGALPGSFWDGVWLHTTATDLTHGGGAETAALVFDRFAEVKLEIDLTANTVDVSYDGAAFYSTDWDRDTNVDHTPQPAIGGLNFWAAGSAAGLTGTFYVDDFNLTPEPATLAMLAMGGGMLLKRRRRA